MKKKRVLITISLSNSIRYILRTGLLFKIRDFCEPVLVFTWDQEDVIKELREEGFKVYVADEGKWQGEYNLVRKKIDVWFDWFALKYPSKKIERKYLGQFVPFRTKIIRRLREYYHVLQLLNPAFRRRLFKEEKELILTCSNYSYYEKLLKMIKPDTVFTLTPFHRQEDILLRVCKDAGLQMITSILSFDNITKRGWIPVEYDVYLLWNKYNKQELQKIYPRTKEKPVHITGAPQFDFYFNKNYLLPESEWKKAMGISNQQRSIILYAGGPKALFPNEPQYLKHLNQAISDGLIRNRPLIYFRCHPIDRIERWKNEVGESDNIIYDESWTGSTVLYNANVSDDDIKKLCSTLAYCDVHINLCSTMTVDGSAYHKPQIAPYYDEENKKYEKELRRLFMQQHFLPILKTGGLQLAHSKEDMIRYVNEGLEKKNHGNQGSEKILKEIITYTDGKSTDRVVMILEQALASACQHQEVS